MIEGYYKCVVASKEIDYCIFIPSFVCCTGPMKIMKKFNEVFGKVNGSLYSAYCVADKGFVVLCDIDMYDEKVKSLVDMINSNGRDQCDVRLVTNPV